jgi:hypothetical protein
MSSDLIIILHMEKCFLMKSNFRRAYMYLSNGLECFSEIKSGVLSDQNSILLSNNIYCKRETLSHLCNNLSTKGTHSKPHQQKPLPALWHLKGEQPILKGILRIIHRKRSVIRNSQNHSQCKQRNYINNNLANLLAPRKDSPITYCTV